MMPDDLRGRMVDLDAHLMLYLPEVEEILGAGPGSGVWPNRGGSGSLVDEVRRMIVEDGLDPSGEGEALLARRKQAESDVWSVRLWGAHGAQVAADRVDALDKMGIGRQLLFSQFMSRRSTPTARRARRPCPATTTTCSTGRRASTTG